MDSNTLVYVYRSWSHRAVAHFASLGIVLAPSEASFHTERADRLWLHICNPGSRVQKEEICGVPKRVQAVFTEGETGARGSEGKALSLCC